MASARPYSATLPPTNGYPNLVAVATADGTDLPTRGVLYIGTGGDVKFDTEGGQTVTLTVGDRAFLPIIATRVYLTGTTATNIFVAY